MKKIQVGFLMSYDYELLKRSIPPVYAEADTITIALDKNLNTWSGGKFEVDPAFFKWIQATDPESKISFYQEDFYDPELNAMENEVRERKMLAQKMGIGNWIIQLDCDEYFLNFREFVSELRSLNKFLDHPQKTPVQVAGFYVNLYKYTGNGILYVNEARNQKFATNFPDYRTGRNTKQRVIYTKNLVLHECLSRSEAGIRKKFENWGHSHQVNFDAFIEKWRMIDKHNYKNHQNFFYLEPEKWKHLEFAEGNSIPKISENIDYSKLMPSNFFIWKKNFGQWFKNLL